MLRGCTPQIQTAGSNVRPSFDTPAASGILSLLVPSIGARSPFGAADFQIITIL